MTYLESRSVKEPTRLDYIRRMEEFNRWLGPHVIPISQHEEVDNILVEYLQDLFESGAKLDAGIRIHAAIRFLHPSLGKISTGSLPRCVRALKGWKNADPPLQRVPLPLEAFGAILGFFLAMNKIQMVVHLFLQWMTYMRPGEASGLTVQQLVAPTRSRVGVLNYFAVLLHPSEMGVPGKTGHFDQGILVDSDLWINSHLSQLIHQRPLTDRLWTHSHKELLEVFQMAVNHLHLNALGVSLYSLRHGGASFDVISQRRDLAEVKQRGRWSADSSLRRYVKVARLQSEMHKIHPSVVEYGRFIMNNLPQMLGGQIRIPPPPLGMKR